MLAGMPFCTIQSRERRAPDFGGQEKGRFPPPLVLGFRSDRWDDLGESVWHAVQSRDATQVQ